MEQDMPLRFKVDTKNQERALKIIKKYPDHFGFIDPDDLLVVKNTYARSGRRIAYVQLMPPELEPMLGHKVILSIMEFHWDNLSFQAKLMVLFHELLHVEEEDRELHFAKKYRLKPHEIQDFFSIIEMYGVHWQRDKKLPNILKDQIKFRKNEANIPVLG